MEVSLSWKVTPHRYEHGNPAMTGDEEWNILDLDDDLVQEECEGIVEKLGAAWIRARLDFYGRRREELFRPSGQLLPEAPTRRAQIMAETLMWMVGEDLAHMQTRSKDFKRAMTNFEQDGNQGCWIQAYSFISLYWDDLELIKKYGCVDEEGQPMEVDERAHSAGVEELKAHGRRVCEGRRD